MLNERRTITMVFDSEYRIQCSEALKAFASENHLFPLIRRIAIAQHGEQLHQQKQQLWIVSRLHGTLFLSGVYSLMLETLVQMTMKGLVLGAGDICLWYDDGVLMLPDEE